MSRVPRHRLVTLLGAVAVFVLLAALTASSGAAMTDRASATAKGPSGNVTLSGWASSPAETAALKATLSAFAKKYPNIHVNYAPINGDYPAAMLAKFAARKPPDVFYVDSNVAPDWMSQGVLEPLDQYIAANHFSTKPFFARLLSAFRYKGHIYGFPKDWSPLAMETNNAMMAKAGVKPPTTWAGLKSVAEKLTTSNAVPNGTPLCVDPDWARMLAFIYQNKGTFLNKSKTAPTVLSPAVKGAVNYYFDFIRKGLGATHDKLGVGWCGEALGKEKAAIIFEGNWVVGYMQDTFPGVSYKISPLPKGKVNGNLGFTVSYSMGKNSKNKAAGWVLLSYLTGPQGMHIWTKQGIALPSRRDVAVPAGRSAFLKQAGYAHPWQFAPHFSKVIDTANNELTAVFQFKETVDTMLQKVNDAAKEALAGG